MYLSIDRFGSVEREGGILESIWSSGTAVFEKVSFKYESMEVCWMLSLSHGTVPIKERR